MRRRKHSLWFYSYHFMRRPGVVPRAEHQFFWFVGLKSKRKGWD